MFEYLHHLQNNDITFTIPGRQVLNRIALVCNNASVTRGGLASRVALMQNGFKLVKLFSPEHGLSAAGEDGAYQQDDIDSLTGLPIISLYGNKLAPSQEDLQDIDLVIFDIPDIGCRFYTYLWTLTHVMQACAENDVLLVIADRPNPIGGNLSAAEGPMLDEINCASFIGRWRIPVRHSCTLGELALYFAATKVKGLQLKVIPACNWQRNQKGSFVFTPTSPAIQKLSTALLYPGMGLLEGINVNEGRGTATPFEICGAPWINAEQLHEAFANQDNPGIIFRTISYRPEAGLYAGVICNGLSFTVINENDFRPVKTGISLIQTILQLYPLQAKERLYCTVANPTGSGHLDKLLGLQHAFAKIKNGENITTDLGGEWQNIIKDYLLY